ncbi:MAG: hypothetical protein PF508_02155 [Spirochaeta sp.]|nr:hypothetical protein [Spirochaeta sp.]
MSDYNVTFAGLPLESPVIIETDDDRLAPAVIEQCVSSGAGGILFPTLTEERITRVNDESELTEHNRDDQGTRDSERILRRLNAEQHLHLLEEAVEASSVPVIGSLQCEHRRHWFSLSQQMKDAGAAAIEIRPYRDAAHRAQRSDHVEKALLRTTSYVADRLDAPLIVRVPAFMHGLQAFVHALGEAGAAGVLIEPPAAMRGVDIDSAMLADPVEDRTAAYAAFLTALSAGRVLYRRVSPHIAMRLPEGVSSSLVMAILGGASLATLPVGGNDADEGGQSVRRYLLYLKKWMTAHSAQNLFDFRGGVSESRLHSSLENQSN